MSYDLHVFGRGERAAATLEDVLREHHVESGERYRLVSRRVRGSLRPAFGIDGPLRVEREDVPAEVLATVLAPDTLLEVTVVDGSAAALALARRTARALAAALGGAVFDPQDDVVTWPLAPRRGTAAVPRGTGRVDALALTWTSLRAPDAGTVRGLLDLLGSVPEAAPVRFGAFEPLQHRLDDNPEAFVRAVLAEDFLSWRARRPFVWGHSSRLSWTGAATARRPLHGVGLDLLLPALDDPGWRAEVAHLFRGVADRLGCFYAQAAVSRGHAGASLSSGARTVAPTALATVRGWRGLPDHPVWLAWFGRPYAPLVEPYVGASPFLRTAEHPADALPLPVPAELVLSGYRGEFGQGPGTPAAVIPPPLPRYEPPPDADG